MAGQIKEKNKKLVILSCSNVKGSKIIGAQVKYPKTFRSGKIWTYLSH